MKLDLDEALQAFIVESRELLDQMEAALLCIEQQPDDPETINAIFRAAHTIKGSAGIFGLDGIVAFTHTAESVLDEVRCGQLRIDHDLATTLLAAGDHVRQLVQAVVDGRPPDDDVLATGADLRARLLAVLAPGDAGGTGPAADVVVPGTDAYPGTGAKTATTGQGPAHWHISLRFGIDTIREGFDPLSFVRFLSTLGQLQHVELMETLVPPLATLMEPDNCHLGFEIALATSVEAAAIEQVFDFVRDGSRIVVLPPGSPASAYQALADADPLHADAVQEALLRCGSWPIADACAAPPEADAAGSLCSDAGGTLAEATARGDTGTASSRAQATNGAVRPAAGGDSQMLRVDAAKLDHLINLVGELLIAGAGASLVARRRRDKELVQATGQVNRLLERVRDSTLSLRMVQIGATFNRFQRVVRDLSKELGKDITLQISGAETELDKTVVERLADPLTHLVRNAMDHGIESAEERLAAGKPAQGTVHLHALHEAGQVVVEISDDGRGLSRTRILEVAMARGLVAADAQLSDQEVYQLIFQPGFSTAKEVSTLSGRGVGMDVVSQNINALRGSIDIDTTPGQGTTVRLRLPLTLAIIDGFLIGVGGASYVVPLSAVVECVELGARHDPAQDWLDLRGRVLPLVRMRELYGIQGAPGRRQNVVVVRSGDQQLGLVVDHLQGELQTVIRPLGAVFEGVPGISGFTILGTGAVALLLDVGSLLRRCESTTGATTARVAPS